MKKAISLMLALGLSVSVMSTMAFADEIETEAAPVEESVAVSEQAAEDTTWPLHHVDVRIAGTMKIVYQDVDGNEKSTEDVEIGVFTVSMTKNGEDMGYFYSKPGTSPDDTKEFEWRNDQLCLSVDDTLTITAKVGGTLADGTTVEEVYEHTYTREELEVARMACPGHDSILAGLDLDVAITKTIRDAAPLTPAEPVNPDKPDPDPKPDEPKTDPVSPSPDTTTTTTTAATQSAEPVATAAPAAVTSIPQTADNEPLALYAVAALASALGLGVVYRRRSNH